MADRNTVLKHATMKVNKDVLEYVRTTLSLNENTPPYPPLPNKYRYISSFVLNVGGVDLVFQATLDSEYPNAIFYWVEWQVLLGNRCIVAHSNKDKNFRLCNLKYCSPYKWNNDNLRNKECHAPYYITERFRNEYSEKYGVDLNHLSADEEISVLAYVEACWDSLVTNIWQELDTLDIEVSIEEVDEEIPFKCAEEILGIF